MLTYALDEYGDFEGLKKDREPIFIGGLIYDDHDVPGEEEQERKRLEAYYRAVIRDAAVGAENAEDFKYPEALHSDGRKDRDHTVVRPVKERVGQTLSEFIQKGTYKGQRLQTFDHNVRQTLPDRAGEYHIFVILKSDQGMTRLLSQHANILAKDDFASNLYFHMADELICRLIFYNPMISDIKEIALDLATRRSALLESSSPLFREYKAQGYKAEEYPPHEAKEKKDRKKEQKPDRGLLTDENKKTSGSRYQFRLTNPDIYRSVIAEEILDAEQPNIGIARFNVDSIGYHSWDAKSMGFLYMADSICSRLSHQIEGECADVWLSCILRRTQELTGKTENLVFGYDEIDNLYAKAWMKYREGDYYKALSISYDAGKLEGAFAEYYKSVWFRRLEERIVESTDLSNFNMAVRKLNETLNNNTLDQDKCCYILGVLEKMVPHMEKIFRTVEARRILYMLYDIGVTSCCHIGDSQGAEKYFEKCTAYAGMVSLEDYLNTRNKLVVFCCDYFDLHRAEVLADENIMYQEVLTDMKKDLKLPGMCEAGFEAMGKTISQRGQVHAFRRDARAEAEFRRALSYFAVGSANYKITQSYLLQYYLDTNNKEAYLAEADTYFESRKLIEQLRYIVREGAQHDQLINVKYALYVYVRALYRFRLSELTDKVWTELQKVECSYGKKSGQKDWKLTGHPSELIFKYMRLLALSRNESETEEAYAERMAECLHYHGATVDAIQGFGELEILDQKKDYAKRDALSLELCRCFKEKFDVFAQYEIPLEGEDRYAWLQEHMTFMYR